MRPHIDWLAGFSLTLIWASAVGLTFVYVNDERAGSALILQATYALAATAWVGFMVRRFAR